jgi:hypothetical protein
MNAFEYLSVLISIILALGMTRLLAGVGEMLQARSRCRVYWVHAIWIVNLFLSLVIQWWILYRWRNQQSWTFFLFVFVLIAPTILYLAITSNERYHQFYAIFFLIMTILNSVALFSTLA